MDETSDPGRGRELVESVESHEDTAMLESRRRVARPRAAHSDDQRGAEEQPPPAAEAASIARSDGGDREACGRQDPHQARLDVDGRRQFAKRPGRFAAERGDQDAERGRLSDGDTGGAERDECPEPSPHLRQRAGRHRRPKDEQRKDDAAHGNGLSRERQAAQNDVKKRGHVVQRARRPAAGTPAHRSRPRPGTTSPCRRRPAGSRRR